jgi:hypothetical protein
MTQDPSGQPPETGYIGHGEVMADGQGVPVTHFQKVASAHRDEPDVYAPPAGQDDVAVTRPDGDVAAVTSSDGLNADEEAEEYWSTRPNPVAAVDQDEVVPVTRADALASSAGTGAAAGAETGVTADMNRAITVQDGYASLLPDAADIRTQWQRIQFMFVDDPRASVTEAAGVIDQVAARLQAAIQERQGVLRGRWDAAAQVDTELLRETLRMYRSFLYQLIGPGGASAS